MARIRLLAVIGTAALSLAMVAAAPAQQVPPGLSGAEQYVETLPSVSGGKPTRDGLGDPGGGAPAEALGPAKARRLEALGADGRGAARLAAQGVPKGRGSRAAEAEGAGPSGSTSIGQVVEQLTGTGGDGGGMGLLLPLLIAMAAVAATAFGIGRRRAGRDSQLDG
jgi:hypothetical protein